LVMLAGSTARHALAASLKVCPRLGYGTWQIDLVARCPAEDAEPRVIRPAL
jgi:hypothetical protein